MNISSIGRLLSQVSSGLSRRLFSVPQTCKLHSITPAQTSVSQTSSKLVRPDSKQPLQQFLQNLQTTNNSSVLYGTQQVRCKKKRQYFEHSATKRINKYNIEKRMSTIHGRSVLWRRFLKGRHQYAPFPYLLPEEYFGRILPARQKHLHKPFECKSKYRNRVRYAAG